MTDSPVSGPARKVTKAVKVEDSPVGKAISLSDDSGGLVVPRKSIPTDDAHNVGEGDFTVALWMHPAKLKREGVISLGNAERSQGWFLDVADRGVVRFQTGLQPALRRLPKLRLTLTVSTPTGAIHDNAWQHIAVVMRRGRNDARIYVNGSLITKAAAGYAEFDDLTADLRIGHTPLAPAFDGQLADVRIYRRPLDDSEILALVQPGKQFVKAAPAQPRQFGRAAQDRRPDVTLTLGDREFDGSLQPAFLVVRLDAGELPYHVKYNGALDLKRIALTPVSAESDIGKKFQSFEKRSPRLGVQLGLRRDCGSTFAPVGAPQNVAGEKFTKYVFEGAIDNFPTPVPDKDIVNYLGGAARDRGPQRVHRWARHAASGDSVGGVRRALLRRVAAGILQEHLRGFRPQERSAGLWPQDHS